MTVIKGFLRLLNFNYYFSFRHRFGKGKKEKKVSPIGQRMGHVISEKNKPIQEKIAPTRPLEKTLFF